VDVAPASEPGERARHNPRSFVPLVDTGASIDVGSGYGFCSIKPVVDLDRDKNLDLVAIDYVDQVGQVTSHPQVVVALGTGSGSFKSPSPIIDGTDGVTAVSATDAITRSPISPAVKSPGGERLLEYSIGRSRSCVRISAGPTAATIFEQAAGRPADEQPPLVLPSGGGIALTCSWNNAQGVVPVVYGVSVNDERCTGFVSYYPAAAAHTCVHTSVGGGLTVCCPGGTGCP
jgi:Copper type II ascorbate-dependent monooxygenase, C-terminal domain